MGELVLLTVSVAVVQAGEACGVAVEVVADRGPEHRTERSADHEAEGAADHLAPPVHAHTPAHGRDARDGNGRWWFGIGADTDVQGFQERK
mgnify:CR=1 FL=1